MCYPLLPLLPLFTSCYPCYPCSPLLPLFPIVTPDYSCYPLLPSLPYVTLFIFGYFSLFCVTLCYPVLPFFTLVTTFGALNLSTRPLFRFTQANIYYRITKWMGFKMMTNSFLVVQVSSMYARQKIDHCAGSIQRSRSNHYNRLGES